MTDSRGKKKTILDRFTFFIIKFSRQIVSNAISLVISSFIFYSLKGVFFSSLESDSLVFKILSVIEFIFIYLVINWVNKFIFNKYYSEAYTYFGRKENSRKGP